MKNLFFILSIGLILLYSCSNPVSTGNNFTSLGSWDSIYAPPIGQNSYWGVEIYNKSVHKLDLQCDYFTNDNDTTGFISVIPSDTSIHKIIFKFTKSDNGHITKIVDISWGNSNMMQTYFQVSGNSKMKKIWIASLP